ncbi:hypothetical protein O3G_MSEX000108 [Manduca sexta]|nr:hypothetical protein O3G_MSEX000108 [Manduca sexta]
MWTRIPLLVIFIPLPSVQHFIWPLNNCVLADICNHTWIPECGAMGKIFRLFIDECDMFEFNCDRGANYIITNYTDCFGPATGCPPLAWQQISENRRLQIYGRKKANCIRAYNPFIACTYVER